MTSIVVRANANVLGLKPGEERPVPDHPDVHDAIAAGLLTRLDGGAVEEVDGDQEEAPAPAPVKKAAPVKRAAKKATAAKKA